MKSDNIIQVKSFAFAIKVVDTYKYLIYEQKEYIISKQFLKSGTSIGANIEEAIGGQSKADFLSKLSIAYKEAREVIYWTRLLGATGYLEIETVSNLNADAEEICRIIGSIQKSVKSNTQSNS